MSYATFISHSKRVCVYIGSLRSTWWLKAKQQNKAKTEKHWQGRWYIWMWVAVFEQQIWLSLREHFRVKNISKWCIVLHLVKLSTKYLYVIKTITFAWLGVLESHLWENLDNAMFSLYPTHLQFCLSCID